MKNLSSYIREIPDFPSPGICFKDVTPLLAAPTAFNELINALKIRHASNRIDAVVGIESRGFILASALAYALETGLALVRKPGKLPYSTYQKEYTLEYGSGTLEIHRDAFTAGQRILILDDVLATGGTAAATAELIQENFEVEIAEINFLLEIEGLNGRSLLKDFPIHAML